MAEIKVQSVIGVGHAYLCHRAAHRMLNCSRIAALCDLGAGDREMVFDGDGYILRPLGYRLVYRNYCFLDRIEFCPREEGSLLCLWIEKQCSDLHLVSFGPFNLVSVV
ncbi:hypothetical protein AAC387_Pa01g1413 [Persea americana]